MRTDYRGFFLGLETVLMKAENFCRGRTFRYRRWSHLTREPSLLFPSPFFKHTHNTEEYIASRSFFGVPTIVATL
jgi:hypothetical protein